MRKQERARERAKEIKEKDNRRELAVYKYISIGKSSRKKEKYE
jgi:hypothetical protein